MLPAFQHVLVIAFLLAITALFFWPRRSFTEQFIEEADALRDSIKNESEEFDRDACENAIMDLIQIYRGRVKDELYKEKMDEVRLVFNNRSVKQKMV